jgi:hypothetical protein
MRRLELEQIGWCSELCRVCLNHLRNLELEQIEQILLVLWPFAGYFLTT